MLPDKRPALNPARLCFGEAMRVVHGHPQRHAPRSAKAGFCMQKRQALTGGGLGFASAGMSRMVLAFLQPDDINLTLGAGCFFFVLRACVIISARQALGRCQPSKFPE